jgi:hypothetical protein
LGESPAGYYTTPKLIALKKNNGNYHPAYSDTITLKGSIGFGLEAGDFLNDISNQCGIYSIELSVNERVIYLFRIDEFSFSESAYINAHADYRAMIEKNKKIHLLYRKPNNRLSLYPVNVNDGIISFNPGEISKVDIRVKDAYGNNSELNFFVKGSAPAVMTPKSDSVLTKIFKWNIPNYYENSQFRLILQNNSLYEDCVFNYARSDAGYQSIYPYTHYIGDRYTPLYKPAEISFSAEIIPERLRNKTVVAMVEDSNKITCLFSTLNGERISAQISKLGQFTLVIDTVAPTVIPLNLISGANMKSQNSIRFQVYDELSGIFEYQGFIDKSWVLFEYDPKNELIEYTFDSARLISGTEHELELYVKDAVGNLKLIQRKFIW